MGHRAYILVSTVRGVTRCTVIAVARTAFQRELGEMFDRLIAHADERWNG